MNQEIKDKWIKALRSGEYKQGNQALCRIEQGEKYYCCLGVLTDLFVKEFPDVFSIVPKIDHGVQICYYESIDEYGNRHMESSYLPNKVKDWAGLEHINPSVPIGPGESLSQVNDSGASFEDIAAAIEISL